MAQGAGVVRGDLHRHHVSEEECVLDLAGLCDHPGVVLHPVCPSARAIIVIVVHVRLRPSKLAIRLVRCSAMDPRGRIAEGLM